MAPDPSTFGPGATVLLTGASGFTAKHICLRLLDEGYRVRACVRSRQRAEEVRAALRPRLADPDALEHRLDFAILDLLAETGWPEAMRDVDVLLHTATPFGPGAPHDADTIAGLTVEATLRPLRAAAATGIRRAVLTSSMAAITEGVAPPHGRLFGEDDWSDADSPAINAYAKAKTLAEKAAWNFVDGHARHMALTAINPGLVVGPPLDAQFDDAFSLLQRMVCMPDAEVPDIGLACVDVRDVAEMHLRAIGTRSTFGERLIAAAGYLTAAEMARIVAAECPDRAPFFTQATGHAPRRELSNAKARRLLGMEFTSAEDAVRATVRFMIDNGLVA